MTQITDKLQEEVRQRAKLSCEYCYLPEGFSARKHQLDHIIPQNIQQRT